MNSHVILIIFYHLAVFIQFHVEVIVAIFNILTPNHSSYLSSLGGFSFIPVNESVTDSFVFKLSWIALIAPSTLTSSPLKNFNNPSRMESLFTPDLRTLFRKL